MVTSINRIFTLLGSGAEDNGVGDPTALSQYMVERCTCTCTRINKCFLACITNQSTKEFYQEEMEGKTITHLIKNHPEIRKMLCLEDADPTAIDILSALQHIHHYRRKEDWEEEFNTLSTILKEVHHD